MLILCDSDAAAKRTVSFLKAPPEKSLATTAAYQAVLEKLSPEADVIAFGNIAQVIALTEKHAAARTAARVRSCRRCSMRSA